MRLNKFIAAATGKSRREADFLIESGKVQINGTKAILGAQVSPSDKITLNNRLIEPPTAQTTILLHKPVGYLSSRRSQGGDPTVYDLLPSEFLNLKTAGRLDKDSSGLILLSSDGDLIQQLTHPKFAKTKIYEVELDRPLEPFHQQMISDFGIDLPDGKSQLTLEKMDDSKSWRVTMAEGRNRQIRRTFAALDYTVTKLHRTDFGNYHLGYLGAGKWKKL